MVNETTIFFDKVKHFRYLLTEGVSDKLLVNAINNHQYLYIFYDGDNSIESGWRTIRPFRLGLLKSKTENNGQLALRAWQDSGAGGAGSDAYIRAYQNGKVVNKKRMGHDVHLSNDLDKKGNRLEKPGWRLFLVHNITQAYPVGTKFEDDNGRVKIPPLYKETDKFIPTAIAMVSKTPPQPLKTTGVGSVVQPDVLTRNAAQLNRKATKADIEGLYNQARKIYKKSPNDFNVKVNDRGEFSLQDVKVKKLKPNEKIVGDLMGLYGKYVKPPKATDPAAERFKEKEKQKTLQNLKVQDVQENITNFPVQKKTFFK